MCGGGTSKPSQPYRNDPNVAKYYSSTGDEYNDWETANYKYQQAETKRIQGEQMAMQQSFYEQQERAAQQQMALQKQLQEQQIQAQKELAAMEQAMQEQQAQMTADMETQRLKFEKNSTIATADAQRDLELSQKAADKQTAFEVGRANKNRKNGAGALASKGTKSLQIGLNTIDDKTTAGLAIPT